jgi:hypothetical protein
MKTKLEMRDYFAIKAMPIALKLFIDSHGEELPYVDDETGEPMNYEEAGSCGIWYPQSETFATACYSIADNMMKAREK